MKEQASVCGRFAGSAWAACSSQQESLVMDAENPADSSHPHSFEIELTGLLLKGWIFAALERLKDPLASLATVALNTKAGAIENLVRMSTGRTLHR